MYVIIPHNKLADEVLEEQKLSEHIDMDGIVGFNHEAQKIMEEKDSGRPGHYWGRDMVIEGSVPVAAFMLAPLEFGNDPDWWKDDKHFQDYMKRHPNYSWLKR